MSQRQACPSNELVVTVLYGEAGPDEQAALQAHLAACPACREEFEALGGVRQALRDWEAPQLRTNFRLVSEAAEPLEGGPARVLAGPSRWWASPPARWAGVAAAAMLTVGVSARIANLDITIGSGGLRVRTGWSQSSATAAAPASARPAPDAAPWRAELAALEQRMRNDMASRPAPVPAAGGARSDDEALLRRVQVLIDQAETRQQQNLALRMTELARDFDMQRKADFVQIQQGLGKIEGRAEAEAARTQQMMNYLVRTASTTPR